MKTKRTTSLLTIVLVLISLLGVLAFTTGTVRAASVTVTANFATEVDYPLSKTKFAVYNSCIVPIAQYNRDINFINEIKPDSLRIDGALGGLTLCGIAQNVVSGMLPVLQYNFASLDQLATLLNQRNVLPYWSYSYQPVPLQPAGGDGRSPPSDLNAWRQVLQTYASHFRQTGNPVGYHEIWNEPDLPSDIFFTGSQADYHSMYNAGVQGLRQGDPDAHVGGLSSAYETSWIQPYLDYVSQNNLPRDFISIHLYPRTGLNGNPGEINAYLNTVKGYLAGRSTFNTTELHLNEYNSYPIDYPQGGVQDKVGLASSLLRDYQYFLSQPYLDKVHWAQFMDSGQGNYSGMVTIGGRRKAVFNAAKIYAVLPVDRRQVSITGASGVAGLAGVDGHEAGLVLWNRSGTSHNLSVNLNNIPFSQGTLRVDPTRAGGGCIHRRRRVCPHVSEHRCAHIQPAVPGTWLVVVRCCMERLFLADRVTQSISFTGLKG